MKHLLLIMLSFLLMVSCITSEERAEKVVREYSEAILNNDCPKMSLLTYNNEEVRCEEPKEITDSLDANLAINIKRQCQINS